MAHDARSRLGEVARVFTKLGFTSFGGPPAHIALMEEEAVRRRGWLDRRHFLDLLAAVNFIPGPNSTEVAIQLGLLRAGWPGMFVAGFCFIVPAMLIVLPLAWLYVTFAASAAQPHPAVGAAFGAISAGVVAIVAAALLRFIKAGVRDRFTFIVALAATALGCLADPAVAASLVGRYPALAPITRALGRFDMVLIILAIAALAGAIWNGGATLKADPAMWPMLAPLGAMTPLGSPYWQMGGFFLRVGATLFGSGYVLVSYLQAGLVDERRWMTKQQLLDAIAIGQITPGPLLTTATFIGYLLGHTQFGGGVVGGIAGGVLATAAIFLPAFCFVAMLGPLLPRIRNHPLARGALDGMNAAVVALILVVTIRLGAAAVVDVTAAVIAIGSLAVLLMWNLNATWVIGGAALIGVARHFLGF